MPASFLYFDSSLRNKEHMGVSQTIDTKMLLSLLFVPASFFFDLLWSDPYISQISGSYILRSHWFSRAHHPF